jgi:tRNA nucleotidyltransferase (CCA-adding enzyme)
VRVPNDCRELAVLAARHHGEIHRAEELKASTIVKLLERVDAFRRPDRFELLLDACASDFHGRLGFEARPYAPAPRLRKALEAARAVDAGTIARKEAEADKIAAAVHEARVHAVHEALSM